MHPPTTQAPRPATIGPIAEPAAPAPAAPPGSPRRTEARLAATCACHAAVDWFGAVVIPLLTVLEGRLEMTPAQGAVIVGLGSLCSGGVQPLVAWLSDRLDTRWFGTLGMAVAVLAISCVGLCRSFADLLVVQAVGAAGVGAFHPVAAASMGFLSGSRRALGLSVFFTTGMAGAIGGSLFAPWFVRTHGLAALTWMLPFGLVFCVVLAWATHGLPHRPHGARDRHRALSRREQRRRWTALWFLYAANVLRFLVNMALIQLLIRWAERVALRRADAAELTPAVRLDASQVNGWMQAALAIGMALGGLACGAVGRARHERAALLVGPMIGAVACLALTGAQGAAAWLMALLAGVGYFGVIPMTIGLGQRLLPHRASLVSGILMGGGWLVAAAAPPLSQWSLDRFGLEASFVACAVGLALSGVLGLAVPERLLHDVADARR